MGATVGTIVGAVLASQALFGFVQFLISRKDKKTSTVQEIKKQLESQERDILRTQLLLLILMRPEEKQEILTISERYFSPPPKGLDGDWYMTSIFYKWLEKEKIAKPEWFDNKKMVKS